MGTSCMLYVEMDCGNFIGTYCHFDGYNEHMIPALDGVTYDFVYAEILKAGLAGGFRVFDPLHKGGGPSWVGGGHDECAPLGIEYLNEHQCYVYSPERDFRNHGASYIYIKYADNTIKHRATYERPQHGDRWLWHTPNTPLSLTASRDWTTP